MTLVLAAVLGLSGGMVARFVERSEREAFDDRLKRTAELSRETALAAVERELLTRESELESLLGQLAAVRDRVDLASITVNFGVEDAPALAAEPEPSDDIPAPSRTLKHGWVGLGNVAKGLAAVAAFALPFVVVVGPLVLLWRVVQRRPRRLAP